ncbi:MAG: hypothetical protein HY924_13385 [Elusimicrobia bacterium]|nr:hypothetical protein [Elusimicrobiota bacterium]
MSRPAAAPGRWLAPLLLAVLAAVLCGPALLSGGDLVLGSPHEDMHLQLLAWRDFGFRELRAGNLAFWNPHIFSGLPFFASFESGLLYPPNWLHLILPVGAAVNTLVTLHLFLAGLLAYLWCRRSGQSPWGAGLAGTMYMLGAPYYLNIYAGLLPPLWVITWIPAVFLCLDAWLESRRPGWCLLGMAAVALQALGGNPQYAYYTGLGSGLYFLVRLPDARGKPGLALGGLAVFAGGLALAAVQLLPALDAVAESARGAGLSLERSGTFSLPPENLLTLVSPFVFGDMKAFPYFGRCHLWGSSLFIGASSMVLALCGALQARPNQRKVMTGMAALTVLLALGAHLKPLHAFLYHFLPGYGSLRGTHKFLILTSLFLSWLAGAGLDKVLEQRAKASAEDRSSTAALLILLAAVLFAGTGFWLWASGTGGSAGAAWTWLLRHIEASGECLLAPLALIRHPVFVEQSLDFTRSRLLETAGLLALSSGLLWLSRRSRLAGQALLLLAVCELFLFSRAATAVMPSRVSYDPAWRELLPGLSGGDRVLHTGRQSPNIAMRVGLEDVLGYGPLPLKRYADFLAWTQGKDPGAEFPYAQIRTVGPGYRLLRLRYVFSAKRGPPVQEVPAPLPRLSLIRDWKLASGPAGALTTMAEPGFDPSRTVILESEPDPAPAKAPPRAGRAGTASLVRSGTDELEIEADLPFPAILLITDAYAKDWRCRMLEKGPQASCRVMPADAVLRAVPLAAGRHRLLLEYRPATFTLGLLVTLAALLAWVGAWVALRARKASSRAR